MDNEEKSNEFLNESTVENNVDDTNNSILEEVKRFNENLAVENEIVVEDDSKLPKEPKRTGNKKNKMMIVSAAIICVAMACSVLALVLNNPEKKSSTDTETSSKKYDSEYKMSGNSLENFDLYFLKLENKKANKVYSPLSIKYALEMLEEGTDGDSKKQLSSILGQYEARKYTNSKNMSFANSMFIKEDFKDTIKKDYIDSIKSKFDAEVIYDSFTSVDVINKWVSDKTLKLIDKLLEDFSDDPRFVLINALAIDMDWKEKFILYPGEGVDESYAHEKFFWTAADFVKKHKFDGGKSIISGMEIVASFNKYDIVSILGEDSIRKTVRDEYVKYWEENGPTIQDWDSKKNEYVEVNLLDEKVINEYLDQYIKELNSNYKKTEKTTDFMFYTDADVKVFAKDLKEYNGTTLQYVGIMPTSETLDTYVSNIDAEKINTLISNLKELKLDSFKEGVVTKIVGFIPKFKFEYELELLDDLKKLGVTDIFDSNKANLSGLSTEKNVYITKALHKANIEFTQNGIKAAAATALEGGKGAGGDFDYYFDVPVEIIDLTFDKPYMFIIRDKATGEVWFTGTVYEPLLWDDEPDAKNFG